MSTWSARVGLEIHVQLQTATKLFCSCPTADAPPNRQVCPVCYGLPGALPVLNMDALKLGYRVAHALNCQPADIVAFDRKHYFYPDLPKGYQITQHRIPLAVGGTLPLPDGTEVSIRQIHLEEDAAKSRHRKDATLLDFNRAGTPLLEIVTEPALADGTGAASALKMVRMLVRHLDVGSGNMESGAIRCDANVSLQGPGGTRVGPVELKNLNAMRFVRRAVDTEIHRLRQAVSAGTPVSRETRFYDEKRNTTRPGRSKESHPDYRFLPEPDLPPWRPDAALLREAAWTGELPWHRADRWIHEWHIPDQIAWTLLEIPAMAFYMEQVAEQSGHPKLAALRIASDLRHALAEQHLPVDPPPVSAVHMARLVQLEAEGTLTDRTARNLLVQMVREDRDPDILVQEQGLDRTLPPDAIRELVREIIADYPDVVMRIRKGRTQAIGFLVGQVMHRIENRTTDPRTVRRMIEEIIHHG